MSSQPTDPKPVTGYPAPAYTAYAYPAHDPGGNPYYPTPSPLPPSYYPNSASSGSGSSFVLRRLIAVFVAFLLFAGLGTLILWLVIRPSLPDVSITSLAVSSFNVSASSQKLSGAFDLSLEFHNPNSKMVVYYDRVWVGALYDSDSEPLAEATLPPFYQGKRNTTTIAAHLVASEEYVPDQDVIKAIDSDRSRSGGGSVGFHFRVLSWVRFRSGIWRSRRHLMRVYCDDVSVVFKNATSSTASLSGSSQKRCSVSI